MKSTASKIRGNVAIHAMRPSSIRSLTTTARLRAATPPPASENGAINPRWLSDLQKRLQQSLSLKIAPKKVDEVRERLAYLDKNWLELAAGREGFLVDPERRGLDRHMVQWGDMDMMGHVNNVIYNRLAESGRVNWTRNLAQFSDPKYQQEWYDLMSPKSIGLILASIRTDFKFPMTFPDRVTVLHKLVTKPDYSSDRFYLEAVMYSEQQRRPAAKCFEDIVVYDYRAAKKAPLKPFMVDELQATYDLQEQRKMEAEKKVTELQAFVQQVEEGAGAA
ncbi:thioesterase-like superfamily domain-containing protein [Trichoderma pleuroticola]